MTICFIGYGNMAKAIAQGLIKKKQYTLAAAAPSLTKGINKEKIHTYFDNKEAIKDADVLILAVKPDKMPAVLEEIASELPPNCLIISVVTGLSLSWFAPFLSADQAIIRSMPNTPSAIGLGATPMIANDATTAEQKKQAEAIFSSIGITTWLNQEAEIDSFTALSGSGPAYVFLFLEAMIDAGKKMGLEESITKTFSLQTLKGALQLAEESPLTLAQLRAKVTSPNGTTAAALKVLEGQLETLMNNAMQAAKHRAQELGLARPDNAPKK